MKNKGPKTYPFGHVGQPWKQGLLCDKSICTSFSNSNSNLPSNHSTSVP